MRRDRRNDDVRDREGAIDDLGRIAARLVQLQVRVPRREVRLVEVPQQPRWRPHLECRQRR